MKSRLKKLEDESIQQWQKDVNAFGAQYLASLGPDEHKALGHVAHKVKSNAALLRDQEWVANNLTEAEFQAAHNYYLGLKEASLWPR